jgi:transposase
MGNYLEMATQQQIKALLELGWSHRKIGRELKVHRETVARYGADSKPATPIVGENPSTGPPPTAAAHHDLIKQGLDRGLTAQRIWQDLREFHGYPHGYLTVQRYARRLRGRGEVSDRMEHPAGEEGQVDFFKSPAPVWDEESGRWRKPWVFRMTLSCSKHGYEEALWTQEREPFLRAHEHAFLFFGGVPRVVRHDNLKAAVVRACLYDPDVNEVYEAFAQHWDFIPLPSRPSHPEENGVQERSGGYVKDNALKGRRFESREKMNGFLQHWNRTVAQVRIHGTTRRQVLSHFLEVEQPVLRSLPSERFHFFCAGKRTVGMDGFVEVERAYYAAPPNRLCQEVRVRWDDHLVRIFDEGQEVAMHLRQVPGQFTVGNVERPAHKPARQQAYQANLLARAERVGPHVLSWAQAAIEERDVRAYRLLQGVLGLTRRHPKECVDRGCELALEARAFRYRTVLRLVSELAAKSAQAQQLDLIQVHQVIRPLDDYARLAAASGGLS